AAGNGQPPVPVCWTYDTTNPFPDPGEDYQQVYGQLYDVNPPPGDVPPEPPQPPPMTGFVRNYALQKGVTYPENIMNGFRPPALPNLSRLANEFVVCDNWFASVPSQTLTNRSFVHAGTASGYVDNELSGLPFFVNDTPTIFNVLEEQGISWRIYYGSYFFLCMAFLNQRQLDRYSGHLFAPGPRRMFQFQSFLDDAKNGRLPSYSFIEPNFMDSVVYGRENDMHPDAGILEWDGLPSDARFGDELVRKVYQALKASPQWNSTLLVIIFDEHGGCYDHVPPPPAEPPDGRIIPAKQPGYSGFGFDRYGVRVPAVMVSPLLVAGAVDHTLYDHTSVIRTVMQRFEVSGDLGRRVASANALAPPFAEQPRADVPDLPAPAAMNDQVAGDLPHTQIQASLVRAAVLRLSELGAPLPDETKLNTRLSSEAELQRVAAAVKPG
ncbi:MAG TPA: alkaline phosphatase family protein, partial [Bryobacteraceae bacterium]|nr:alkaline phosphatase family protein [Bryobacteraceae bacterium]